MRPQALPGTHSRTNNKKISRPSGRLEVPSPALFEVFYSSIVCDIRLPWLVPGTGEPYLSSIFWSPWPIDL